jgi:hypothetical protein
VRFVEALGAESVLHVAYGEEMIRVVGPPEPPAVGTVIHLTLRPDRLLMIERASDRVVAA